MFDQLAKPGDTTSADRNRLRGWHTHPARYPLPSAFVTSYSSFMKLVSAWKWIDSYKNEPDILKIDLTRSLLIRTMWQRNIQYTSVKGTQ